MVRLEGTYCSDCGNPDPFLTEDEHKTTCCDAEVSEVREAFSLETLGATLRIVDINGADVALLGKADDPKVREFGEFAVQALNTWAYVS